MNTHIFYYPGDYNNQEQAGSSAIPNRQIQEQVSSLDSCNISFTQNQNLQPSDSSYCEYYQQHNSNNSTRLAYGRVINQVSGSNNTDADSIGKPIYYTQNQTVHNGDSKQKYAQQSQAFRFIQNAHENVSIERNQRLNDSFIGAQQPLKSFQRNFSGKQIDSEYNMNAGTNAISVSVGVQNSSQSQKTVSYMPVVVTPTCTSFQPTGILTPPDNGTVLFSNYYHSTSLSDSSSAHHNIHNTSSMHAQPITPPIAQSTEVGTSFIQNIGQSKGSIFKHEKNVNNMQWQQQPQFSHHLSGANRNPSTGSPYGNISTGINGSNHTYNLPSSSNIIVPMEDLTGTPNYNCRVTESVRGHALPAQIQLLQSSLKRVPVKHPTISLMPPTVMNQDVNSNVSKLSNATSTRQSQKFLKKPRKHVNAHNFQPQNNFIQVTKASLLLPMVITSSSNNHLNATLETQTASLDSRSSAILKQQDTSFQKTIDQSVVNAAINKAIKQAFTRKYKEKQEADALLSEVFNPALKLEGPAVIESISTLPKQNFNDQATGGVSCHLTNLPQNANHHDNNADKTLPFVKIRSLLKEPQLALNEFDTFVSLSPIPQFSEDPKSSEGLDSISDALIDDVHVTSNSLEDREEFEALSKRKCFPLSDVTSTLQATNNSEVKSNKLAAKNDLRKSSSKIEKVLSKLMSKQASSKYLSSKTLIKRKTISSKPSLKAYLVKSLQPESSTRDKMLSNVFDQTVRKRLLYKIIFNPVLLIRNIKFSEGSPLRNSKHRCCTTPAYEKRKLYLEEKIFNDSTTSIGEKNNQNSKRKLSDNHFHLLGSLPSAKLKTEVEDTNLISRKRARISISQSFKTPRMDLLYSHNLERVRKEKRMVPVEKKENRSIRPVFPHSFSKNVSHKADSDIFVQNIKHDLLNRPCHVVLKDLRITPF